MKKFAACSGLFLALTAVASCVAGEDMTEEELAGADEETLLAETEHEVAASGDISVKATGTFTFNKTDTNSATQNTVNKTVTLSVGQQLTAAACDVAGAPLVGDSYMRLYGPNGLEVASNDDSCGLGSKITYTATTAGVYTIRVGCFSATACSGTVAWNNNGGNPGPGPVNTYNYSANNTNSAQQNTDDRVITASVGQRITVSICTIYTGDPYLRILGPGGYLIGSNDDGCAAKGATYSFVTTATGSYTIRAGCYAEGSCTGRVEWSVQNVQ